MNPELTLIQRTQVVIFVMFTDHWAITIIWTNKKGTLPVVQNNMIIQCAEIPALHSAKQTLITCLSLFPYYNRNGPSTSHWRTEQNDIRLGSGTEPGTSVLCAH